MSPEVPMKIRRLTLEVNLNVNVNINFLGKPSWLWPRHLFDWPWGSTYAFLQVLWGSYPILLICFTYNSQIYLCFGGPVFPEALHDSCFQNFPCCLELIATLSTGVWSLNSMSSIRVSAFNLPLFFNCIFKSSTSSPIKLQLIGCHVIYYEYELSRPR